MKSTITIAAPPIAAGNCNVDNTTDTKVVINAQSSSRHPSPACKCVKRPRHTLKPVERVFLKRAFTSSFCFHRPHDRVRADFAQFALYFHSFTRNVVGFFCGPHSDVNSPCAGRDAGLINWHRQLLLDLCFLSGQNHELLAQPTVAG
jgi:hypothetical protein